MRLRRSAGALLAVSAVLAACADVQPVDPTPRGVATASPTDQEPSPTAEPTPSESAGLGLPLPGRPFDAAAILEVMRDSRRPGGVPDQLETEAIAAAVAERIWTVDGEPWTTATAGGSCGAVRCTFEIGGSRTTALGEDLWTFEVLPATGEVILLDANLRSMPRDLAGALDAIAAAAEPRIAGLELLLVSARWLPPPEEGAYTLSYRSGNEEGSCELEVRLSLDPADVAVEASNC